MIFVYYLRVFFASYEFSFLIGGLVLYYFFGNFFETHFNANSLNNEAVNWAMLFPVGIVGWTFTSGLGVLFPDERTSKILHEWPDYWKLKIHFNIGILNSILYLLPCLIIWFIGDLTSFKDAWIFLTFTIATSINAFTFYTAKISIKSILIHLK